MKVNLIAKLTTNKMKGNPMKYLSLIFLVMFTTAANKPDLPNQFRLLMKEKQPTYVIANAALPYSFDPLEDLNLNNSRIIRMIHARIVESDAKGRFHSKILESYNYHESINTLILRVKENIKYTDGSFLKPEDVALSIKRNALLRPHLPGVSQLQGLSGWLKNAHPLLAEFPAIKIEKNKIFIKFESNLESPMDKFIACFGVIPSSAVDMKTGKLKSQGLTVPPSAGDYKIVESKLSSGIRLSEPTFIKLERTDDDKNKPEVVWLAYMSPTNIGKYLEDYHDNVVICTHEIDIEPYKLKDFMKHFKAHVAPRIMYSFLILNPQSKTFKDQRVRQYFAKKYRENMIKKGYSVEGSQPTREMLGYLPLETLEKSINPFTYDEEKGILNHLRKNPPIWMKSENIVFEPFSEIFNATCNDLSIPLKDTMVSKFSKEYQELWKNGELSIRLGYSTLGPADPTGGIKTVFSGIHSFLKSVTDDPQLQELVKELKYYDKETHIKLIKYLFVDSKYAVVSNYSRVYFTTDKPTVQSSFRRQEPLVWEFFQQ